MGWLPQRRRGAEDGGVLVEGISRVGRGDGIDCGGGMVSYVVVGVSVGV